jgi:Leucine-rich repeat (LRR) protein
MDQVMYRPRAGQRSNASPPRRIIGALVAFVVSFAALIAMPQAAQAADVVNVPDAHFKAVLNSAIASSTGTTRTPDQDITPAEALTVTSAASYSDDTGATIADFTGVAAFTNLYSLDVYNAAETISLEPFAGSSMQSLVLYASTGDADSMGEISSDLSALGSINGLAYLTLGNYSLPDAKLRTLTKIPTLQSLTARNAGITDAAALSKLTGLTSLDLPGNKLRDLAPVAKMPALASLGAADNLISDIGFVSDMRSLTALDLSGNLIEDVSPLEPLTDKTKYKLMFGGGITVSGNRIADLSPLTGFFGSASVQADPQSIYVGPYQDGGVSIKLRGSRGDAASAISPADAGSYDGATDRLISNDPEAAFLDVEVRAVPTEHWKVYFSEAPDKVAALRLNEVESNGDAVNGDWVELFNPGSSALDLGGLIVADSDNTHKIVVPNGTKISARGYRTIRTDDAAVSGQFGLGSGDSARIFAPGTTDLATDPIDSYSWTAHATTTYGRTVPGIGRWTTTSAGTFGTVNTFSSSPTVTVSGDATSTTGSATLTATLAKPGSTAVATDATGTVVFAVDGKEVSGPVAVTNGKAAWPATGLAGSPSGTVHKITARYVEVSASDPYVSSVPSTEFTVTVTIGEFDGSLALSSSTPEMCQTISSDLSGVTPVPDSVTYQWQYKTFSPVDPWADASAGTEAGFKPAFSVVDGQLVTPVDTALRLVATVSKAGYANKTFASPETASVAGAPFLTKPAATLSTSTPKVGETITATHPKWTSCIPADLNFEIGYDYQWLRDGQRIPGATDEVVNGIGGAGPKKVSYTVTSADAGHKISLQVYGNAAPGLQYEKVISTETSAVTAGAFASSPAPTVDNTSPKVGDTVKASTAAWSPVAAFAYQWLRDGAPITGATSASYTTTIADAGHALSVKATGTAEGYASTDKVTAAATVAKLAFTASPAPVTAGGAPTVGDTLTATVGAWAPAASMSWQWLRDGQPIAGATSASYTTTAADQGRAISVRVTGTVDGYELTEKTSTATPAVAAKPVLAPPAPPVPGVTQVDRSVSSKYSVKVTAASGKKLKVRVSAKGVPTSAIDKIITVKIAGVKGSYAVTVRNGRATVNLGSRAKDLKKGKKVAVTVSLAKLTAKSSSTAGATRTTTTYTVAKATKKVKVKLT